MDDFKDESLGVNAGKGSALGNSPVEPPDEEELEALTRLIAGSARRDKFDLWMLQHPTISTSITALTLASIWIFVWAVVLFFVTFTTSSGTVAYVFLAGLILSTVTEAIIRIFETNPILDRWGRGSLRREIKDVNYSWGLAYLFGGLWIAQNLPDIFTMPTKENFNLSRTPIDASIGEMAVDWYNAFIQSPVMMVSVLVCWVVRAFIYKRTTKSTTWKETTDHLQVLTKA